MPDLATEDYLDLFTWSKLLLLQLCVILHLHVVVLSVRLYYSCLNLSRVYRSAHSTSHPAASINSHMIIKAGGPVPLLVP